MIDQTTITVKVSVYLEVGILYNGVVTEIRIWCGGRVSCTEANSLKFVI